MKKMILQCRKTIATRTEILKDLNHKKKLMLEKRKKLKTIDGLTAK